MLKKHVFLYAAAALAAGALTYSALTGLQQKTTLPDEDTHFSVADTAGIDKIFIGKKAGSRYLLERKPGGYWTINNRWIIGKPTIEGLLQCIHDVEVKRPVTEKEHNTVVRSIAAKHDKVEIFVRGQLLKTYFVGSECDNFTGTYFLMEGSDTPYIAHIRGFDGYLSVRYDVVPDQWRELHVFLGGAQTLKKVKIEYPARPSEGFTAEINNHAFSVNGQNTGLDPDKVSFFMAKLKDLAVNTFYDKVTKEQRDSLHNLTPEAVITFEDSNTAFNQILKLYPFPGNTERVNALLGKQEDVVNFDKKRADYLLVNPAWFRKPQAVR